MCLKDRAGQRGYAARLNARGPTCGACCALTVQALRQSARRANLHPSNALEHARVIHVRGSDLIASYTYQHRSVLDSHG